MAAQDPNQTQPASAGPEFLEEVSEQFRQLRTRAEQTAEAVRVAAAVAGDSPHSDPLVADLAGTLAERGEEIATECQRLGTIIERAKAAAAPADAPEHAPRPSADPDSRAQEAKPSAVIQDPGSKPKGLTADPPSGDVEVSEGVRLLITQMAVAGADRAEIEQRLAEDFGIADPVPVLSELFGPASG